MSVKHLRRGYVSYHPHTSPKTKTQATKEKSKEREKKELKKGIKVNVQLSQAPSDYYQSKPRTTPSLSRLHVQYRNDQGV